MNTLSLNMRLLLLLLATTAHALLHSVKLGGPSPAAWFQDTLGIGTDGDAVCFDDGFRLRFDAAAEPTPCKLGCLGVGGDDRVTRARCEGARLLHASMHARVPRAHEAITAFLALGH